MRLLILLLCIPSIWATDLRLRYGGTASTYRITNISSGTPAVVTIKDRDNQTPTVAPFSGGASNGLGDPINIMMVQGCQNANGFVKVAATPAPTASTFALVTDAGVNITCSAPFDGKYETGWVGKYHVVTLNPHPRLTSPQLAGGSALALRIIDPDGAAGSGVAGMKTENGSAWQGMLDRVSTRTTVGCDGETPALCPKEDDFTHILANSNGIGNYNAAYDSSVAALVWQADKSQTQYLMLAKYMLYHMDYSMVDGTMSFAFPVDDTANFGGVGELADHGSEELMFISRAYDIVYPELSPTHRTRIAAIILNGYDGSGCTNQLSQQSGTVDVIGTTITKASGGLNVYQIGEGIYVKTVATDGGTGLWGLITARTDTSITVSKTMGGPFLAKNHYRVVAYDPVGSNHCGPLYRAGSNSYFAGGVSKVGTAKLTVALGDTDTTMTVDTTINFLDDPPFYIRMGKETIYVTGTKTATQLTGLVRAQSYSALNTTASLKGIGAYVVWSRQHRAGPKSLYSIHGITGDYHHNLSYQRIVGYLACGLSLASEDARGVTLAEDSFNFYYNITQGHLEDFMSGTALGGQVSLGYAWGRWEGNATNVGLFGQFAFSNYAYTELLGDFLFRSATTPLMIAQPGSGFTRPTCMTCSETYEDKSYVFKQLMIGSLFAPSTKLNYAVYWWKNFGGGTAGSARQWVYQAPYMAETTTGTDWRGVGGLDPWTFNTESTFGADRATGMLISRTDWNNTAGLIVAGLGTYMAQDHNVGHSGLTRPGSYFLHKGAKLLIGSDVGLGEAYTGTATYTKLNWLHVGSTTTTTRLKSFLYPWWSNAAGVDSGGPKAVIDRQKGTVDYVYARGNFSAAFLASAGMLRDTRTIIHLKGTAEYFISDDDVAASHSNQMNTRLDYVIGDEVGCAASCSWTWNPAINLATFKKSTGSSPAMINTKLLFLGGASPTITEVVGTNARGININFGSGLSSARFTAIHRTANGTTDAMPTILSISSDLNSLAVQINDGNSSWGLVLSKDGLDRTSRTLTTTFSGNGKTLFTHLTSGTYNVYQDGSPYLTDLVVDVPATGPHGTLLVTTNGAHTWEASQSPPTCSITTAAFSSGIIGTAFSQTATTASCTNSVWSVVSGALPTGLTPNSSTGEISGTPTVGGIFNFTLQAVATENTAQKALSITIFASESEILTIPTILLEPASVGLPYSADIIATGGTLPYTFSLTTPSSCGITISASGNLSGTPLVLGTCVLEVRVTDSLAATADTTIELLIATAGGLGTRTTPSGLIVIGGVLQ